MGFAMDTGNRPSPRFFHAAAFDLVRDQRLIFGGADETAFFDEVGCFNDLWAWSVVSITSLPSPKTSMSTISKE